MIQNLKHGSLLIYDTEWTSWAGFLESNLTQPGRYPEIIQIGAVKLDIADGFRETGSFMRYIRPKVNPELSDYIIELTGITQNAIDEQGKPFPEVLSAFVEFIEDDFAVLMPYGVDGEIVARNCALNDIQVPDVFKKERDLRQFLLDLELVDNSQVSSDLPRYFGLPDEELSHDALGDSRSLANVIRHLRETGKI
ncbi:3'-5' exonuclease [Magnetovibrio sp. PR-2]|uniref:3'-5' exonuclease n=1 Tax=Magnetovibrio sp. PR-2 TaxID=3120356 RepID=UPI002FCE46B7